MECSGRRAGRLEPSSPPGTVLARLRHGSNCLSAELRPQQLTHHLFVHPVRRPLLAKLGANPGPRRIEPPPPSCYL